MGLPYALASHFAPAQIMQAISLYRTTFRPSVQLYKPYVMQGFNVFVAETDDEAQFLATSTQQAFVNLGNSHPKRLPPPQNNYLNRIDPREKSLLGQILSCAAIGSPDTVKGVLQNFIDQTQAYELMITLHIFNHSARLRSYEITA